MKIFIVFLLLSASIFAQGINWGLRFDAHLVNRTYSSQIDAEKNETYYPRFFTTPQLTLNIYPVKQLGVEFRAGYELFPTQFEGGEYTFYGKYHFYQPLYLLAGVCLKKIPSSGERFNYLGTKRFGMPAVGLGGQITRHISAELIYLHGNKRHLGYYGNYDFYPYMITHKYLNYVIKLSVGFNWSIYDF